MKKDFYKQHLIELYKKPENFGELKNPTNEFTEVSSSCGDELTAQLRIKKNKIEEVKFRGSGCMISIVSASLLAEKIKDMKVEDVKKLDKKYILNLLNTKISSDRIKCAVLPLNAIKGGLK